MKILWWFTVVEQMVAKLGLEIQLDHAFPEARG